MKTQFINCLHNNDLEGLKDIPKSDLHNHSTRGGNIKHVIGNSDALVALPDKFAGLNDMQNWYTANIKPYCRGKRGFKKRVEAAFIQAKEDGVTVLTLSFGVADKTYFNDDLNDYVQNIKLLQERIVPNIRFIPEICFTRTVNIKPIEKVFDQILSLNYFKSIDLVGDEAIPVDNYKSIYHKAKQHDYTCRAHAGEFGDAESVKKAVEVLGLNQVQHGISAVNSPEVMRFLASNQIQLNICPTSNIMLSRVKSYREHPVSILYDEGIPITVNTDDMLIFNQSVSEEYLNLYNNGVLSAIELNDIRETGLGLKGV